MTPIEQAARQALEVPNEVTGWQWADPMRVMDEVGDAIAALREALSGVQALSAAPAVAAPAAPTPEHIAAMERAWLWMDSQADQQSKGGHATFDLMMLRDERDALRAAIDAAPKVAPGEPTQEMVDAVMSLVDLEMGDPEDHRYDDGSKLAAHIYRAVLALAPQQEAQEPIATQWLAEMIMSDCGCSTQNQRLLDRIVERITQYDAANTAPQPAPAPLSDDDVRDAARWRMVALIGYEVMLHPEKRTQAAAVKAYMDATHSGLDLTGAVDAALAAQGGRDAG